MQVSECPASEVRRADGVAAGDCGSCAASQLTLRQSTCEQGRCSVLRASAKAHSPALDGIRGLAVLLVLMSHGQGYFASAKTPVLLRMGMTFGWCGVDLFFVLSGFLITGILLDTRDAPNRFTSFLMRRVLRICPVYFLVLGTVFGLSHWVKAMPASTQIVGPAGYLAFAVFVQNWTVLWRPEILLKGVLGHFWSLAVEEQFYLFWPLLVWWVRRERLAYMCFGLALGSLLLRVGLVAWLGPHYWIHALTPTRGEGLLMGSGFAAVAAMRRVRTAEICAAMGVGAGLIAVILAIDPMEFLNTDAGPYMYTVGVSGLGLMFAGLVCGAKQSVAVIDGFGKIAWLRAIGKRSYGLYVFHVPVFLLVSRYLGERWGVAFPLSPWVAAVYVCGLGAISLGVAWVSFAGFETRFLRWKARYGAA